MEIKGMIFDADGTLLDSMKIWNSIGELYLKSKKINPEENLREKLKNMSMTMAAEYFISKYKIEESAEKIIEEVNELLEDFYFNSVLPKEGAVDFLKLLKHKNIRMCIATATDKYLVEKALKRNNMLIFFEKIFTCSEVGSGKDSPVIYNAVLEYMGLEKDNVMVFEDASYAAKTAKQAGFKVCGVFDESETDINALKQNSDFYINSFKEAGDLID